MNTNCLRQKVEVNSITKTAPVFFPANCYSLERRQPEVTYNVQQHSFKLQVQVNMWQKTACIITPVLAILLNMFSCFRHRNCNGTEIFYHFLIASDGSKNIMIGKTFLVEKLGSSVPPDNMLPIGLCRVNIWVWPHAFKTFGDRCSNKSIIQDQFIFSKIFFALNSFISNIALEKD